MFGLLKSVLQLDRAAEHDWRSDFQKLVDVYRRNKDNHELASQFRDECKRLGTNIKAVQEAAERVDQWELKQQQIEAGNSASVERETLANELQTGSEAAHAASSRILTEWNAKRIDIQERMRALERVEMRGNDARATLMDNMPQEIRAQVEPLMAELNGLLEQRKALEIAKGIDSSFGTLTATKRANYVEQIARLEERMRQLNVEMAGIQIDGLNSEALAVA